VGAAKNALYCALREQRKLLMPLAPFPTPSRSAGSGMSPMVQEYGLSEDRVFCEDVLDINTGSVIQFGF
jgi:hypothetical protein